MTTYDSDIREHAVPSEERRAVGTAVVSDKLLHRMVVNSIGVGLGLAQGFHLSAYEHEAEAVESMSRRILAAESRGERY